MRTPQEGGRMVGGPFCGRVMAWDSYAMPAYDDSGKRLGTYVWDDDHWEFDEEGSNPTGDYE